MSKTIFEQIIDGTVPCHKIYEDENTLAFLDVHPIQPGHTLVIPKTPIEFVWDLDQKAYADLMLTVQKVAQHIKSSLSAKYVGSKIVGVDVPYAHVHLIPFSTAEQFSRSPAKSDPDHEALAAMAQTLAF